MSEFEDRRQAGAVLGAEVRARVGTRADVLVLAIGRGGVPVGWEVARAIGATLDVLLVAPLVIPGHDDAIVGAIACGGVHIVDHERAARLGISAEAIERESSRLDDQLRRRELTYRGARPRAPAAGRACLVVDDGLSTPATIHAAIATLRQLEAAEVTFAAPDASREVLRVAGAEADRVITGVPSDGGAWYADFERVGDGEIRAYLDGASARPSAVPAA